MIQTYLIIFAVAISIGFTGGWKVNGWRYESERSAAAEASSEALTAVAKELAKIEVKNTTINQKVREHVIEKPYYIDCKHDADGMRLVNEAITGQPTGDRKLPGTNAVK